MLGLHALFQPNVAATDSADLRIMNKQRQRRQRQLQIIGYVSALACLPVYAEPPFLFGIDHRCINDHSVPGLVVAPIARVEIACYGETLLDQKFPFYPPYFLEPATMDGVTIWQR